MIEVIERVNQQKITSEQNVVVGASMGGIVSRYALAKMENAGKSHCTGAFFTLDTPHNGANIPLALQALGWFYHATGTTDELWDALNTPAARQQLITTLGAELQAGRVALHNATLPYITQLDLGELTNPATVNLRSGLQSQLSALGWPKLPRKLALLDGMIDGTALSNQGFGPGDKYYDASIYANGGDLGTVFKIAMRSANSSSTEDYTINGLDDCQKYSMTFGVSNTLFTIAQPHDFNPCNILVWGSDKVPYKYHAVHLQSTGDLPALDNAPGGLRTDLRTLHARLKSEATGNVTFNNPVRLPLLSFVPTWSALAMGTPLDNTNLFVNLDAQEFKEFNLPKERLKNKFTILV